MLGKQCAITHAVNKEFSLNFIHKIFGSTKYIVTSSSAVKRTFEHSISAATLVTVFGGQGWESRIRQPHGLTLMTLNKTILGVELGVYEQDWAEAAWEAVEHHAAPA
ncbi:hypothetical protein BDR03DRAFT_1018952 [Suillus americanus]|nr:hypothetical protein BDR03DRAFT_1018952 [Suillus americanus]